MVATDAAGPPPAPKLSRGARDGVWRAAKGESPSSPSSSACRPRLTLLGVSEGGALPRRVIAGRERWAHWKEEAVEEADGLEGSGAEAARAEAARSSRSERWVVWPAAAGGVVESGGRRMWEGGVREGGGGGSIDVRREDDWSKVRGRFGLPPRREPLPRPSLTPPSLTPPSAPPPSTPPPSCPSSPSTTSVATPLPPSLACEMRRCRRRLSRRLAEEREEREEESEERRLLERWKQEPRPPQWAAHRSKANADCEVSK